MASLLAVVRSQWPGCVGMPSRRQRSSATSNASWTSSSALSKSPRMRTRAAVSRPASSRKTAATAASELCGAFTGGGSSGWRCRAGSRSIGGLPGSSALHHRPDLYLVAWGRPALGDLDCGVQVGDLEHSVAADALLGLEEWPVGHDRAPIVPADRGGCARRVQLLAVPHLPGGAVLGPPPHDPFVVALLVAEGLPG